MVMDAVVQRFVKQSPATVMARLALQRALEPGWIDALFEQEREQQYTQELLFSTTVELMSVVAMGMRPSLHAAAKACKDLPVSVQAVYDKIKRTGFGARTGARQRPAIGAGVVADKTRTITDGTRLSVAHRGRQSFAGEPEAPEAIARLSRRGIYRARTWRQPQSTGVG